MSHPNIALNTARAKAEREKRQAADKVRAAQDRQRAADKKAATNKFIAQQAAAKKRERDLQLDARPNKRK